MLVQYIKQGSTSTHTCKILLIVFDLLFVAVRHLFPKRVPFSSRDPFAIDVKSYNCQNRVKHPTVADHPSTQWPPPEVLPTHRVSSLHREVAGGAVPHGALLLRPVQDRLHPPLEAGEEWEDPLRAVHDLQPEEGSEGGAHEPSEKRLRQGPAAGAGQSRS